MKNAFFGELHKRFGPQTEHWLQWGHRILNPIPENDDDDDNGEVGIDNYLNGCGERSAVPEHATIAIALPAAHKAAAAAALLAAAGSPARSTAAASPAANPPLGDHDDGFYEPDGYAPPANPDADGGVGCAFTRGEDDRNDGERAGIYDAAVSEAERWDKLLKTSNLQPVALDRMFELTAVDYTRPMYELVWNVTKAYTLPMPLGKFGHPFREGWLWGSVDPRHLLKRPDIGKGVMQSDPEFKQLALEAATLPFAARSTTQRLFVSWALRDKVLPLPEHKGEPDVMFECRRNPQRVAAAVRRGTTSNPEKGILYTEFDAIDLEHSILFRMSRQKDDYYATVSWSALVLKALERPEKELLRFKDVTPYENGPRSFGGFERDDADDVFEHLRKCGLSWERLVGPNADFLHFARRTVKYDEQRKKLHAEYEGKVKRRDAAEGQQAMRDWVDARMEYDAMLPKRPTVRFTIGLPDKAKVALLGPDKMLRGFA